MNKNIFLKMIMIFSIPAIGILFYSGIYTYEKFSNLEELKKINLAVKYVKIAEKLLTQIQKERGLSSVYISSKSNLFKNDLQKQIKKTNKSIKTFILFISDNEFNNIYSIDTIKTVQEKLYKINYVRENTIKLRLNVQDELKEYNQLTNSIVFSMSTLFLKEDNKLFYKNLYSILYLITAKEYAGLERAMIANKLSSKHISADNKANVMKLIAFQEYNIEQFKSSISIRELDYFNKSSSLQTKEDFIQARKKFFLAYEKNEFLITSKFWWEISTKRINSLASTVDFFMENILEESKSTKEKIYYTFIYNLIFCFIVILTLIFTFIKLKKLTKQEHKNFNSLNKLKQIYNILSNTNELIIYDYKMNDVLKQACILARKELDLSYTLVSMINQDGSLRVIESNSRDALNISSVKNNTGNTLYKKAFFEKQSIVIDNILKYNTSIDLIQEKKLNIKSIAVYPLYNDELCVGVLSFCSEKESYFDKEIISVFEKMANDLSYGLLKEEKENTRLKYEEELIIASYAFDSQEAMAITDLDAKIVKINNAFTRITGYSQEEVLGKNPSVLQSGQHDKEFYSSMWTDLQNNGYWSGELYNKRKNGEVYPEKITITAIKNNNDEVTHYIAQFFDITEIKENQEKLIYEIQHDSLTGLNNRIVLEERLKQSIIAANRHNHFGGLLFLDLDNFKYINDSLGHGVGDKVLQHIANILRKISREDDLIIRLGGDEFIILVHNLDANAQKAISAIESFALKLVSELEKSFNIDTHALIVTSSIGVCLFPQFNKTQEDIIKHADSAMYLAKKQGKNKVVFYSDDLDLVSKNHLLIENDLRNALKNDEFELYYQAKYNQKEKRIVGYEALIRWNHPRKGLVFPDEFIHIAEESSLIINIGTWVLENCCKQINTWLKQGIDLDGIKISINFSSLELEQTNFIDIVKDTLRRTKTNAKYLDFEITETTMLDDLDKTIPRLLKLRDLSISLSIDNFGVGFSSLNYISKLPINTIKLDKSFIMDKNSAVNEAIIDMLIKITDTLDLDLVIEGVEELDDINYLVNKNSHLYQGYYISRPVKSDEAIKLLNKEFNI